MDKVDTLNLNIYKDEWFALENNDMDPKMFVSLVNSIEKIFIEQYKAEGAKAHVNKVEKNDRLVLFINQRKVPNIVKSLVQMPNHEIQISLTGMTNQKEQVTRTISKPFEANKVTELVPCYNQTVKR